VLGSVGLGITAVVLAIRNGGLKAEIQEADQLRKAAEAALAVQTTESEDQKLRAKAQIASLRKELERFENEKLDAIEEEPNREKRIAARRNWVVDALRMLPKEADGADRDG